MREQPKIFLPVLGLMKSSKATNKRPSDSGSGIMFHKVCHNLAHGSLLESIACEEGYYTAERRKIAYGGLESWIILLER